MKIFDNAEAAVDEIHHFYRNFHSYRFVKESLVIRMRHALTPEQLKEVRSRFRDLAPNGAIVQGKALAPEYDDPEVAIPSQVDRPLSPPGRGPAQATH